MSSRPRMTASGTGGYTRRRPNRFDASARARTSRRPSPRRRRYLRNSSTGARPSTRRIFCEAWRRGRCLARMPGGRFAGGTSGPDARCRHRPHRRRSFNSDYRIWPLFLLRTHVAHFCPFTKAFRGISGQTVFFRPDSAVRQFGPRDDPVAARQGAASPATTKTRHEREGHDVVGR